MIELKYVILAIAVLMYAFVIIKQDKKILFTTIAAIIIILLGTIFPSEIFQLTENTATTESISAFNETQNTISNNPHLYAISHSFFSLINWNVLMIYVGSMIIAALFIYSKVPVFIADMIVAASPSTGIAIILILAMTGIISIFVENVATVLVMAPIALAMCQKLKINPTYFIIGLAVMSNLEGTATLVGDPPSMIFASYAGYTFNDFFFYKERISIFFFIQMGLLVGCIYFYLFFRKQKDKPVMERTKIISAFPAILLLLMIFGLAALSFLHIEFSFASGGYVLLLGIIGLLWYKLAQKKTGSEIAALVRELDWETIGFLMGIFIVVGAISETGLLHDFAGFLTRVTGGNVLAAFIIILVVSILVSGFVDNVPYIIVMLPVAGNMAHSLGIHSELLMFALLVGSCLGGNLTPFGASANVVSMGILKKEGYKIDFAGWLKIAAPFTVLTTGAAAVLLWFVWS